MSRLLLNEKPLLVMPKLAAHIGLNETIVLQQLHYWIQEKFHNPVKYKDSYKDDYIWVYNTYEDWMEQFPFWSTMTIRRILLSLEKKQLILTGNYNKLKTDRTKWYTIEYYNLGQLEEQIYPQDYFNPKKPKNR